MSNLMDSVRELNRLRQSAKKIEKQLRGEQMDFLSRDGKIRGVINGKLEILSLEIDESLCCEGGHKQLERNLAGTINSAITQMQARVSRLVSGQMGLDLPGM